MSWPSRDDHHRKQWTYSCASLMFIADTQWNCVMPCQKRHGYAWVLLYSNAVASIIMSLFGCKQCYQMPLKRSSSQLTYTTVIIRGETQTVGGPITCLVTCFFYHTNLGHTLGHRVFVGDNHDILSEKIYSFCFLEPLASTALPWPSWWSSAQNVTTKWLTKSCVTKHVMDAPTVWVSPLIITVEPVTLTWFCFGICHDVAIIFCRIDHNKKKSSHSDWPSDGHKHVMKHVLVTLTVWTSSLILQ